MEMKLSSIIREKTAGKVTAQCILTYTYLTGLAAILIDLSLHTTMFYKLFGDHTKLHLYLRLFMAAVIIAKLCMSDKHDWKKTLLITVMAICFYIAYDNSPVYEDLIVLILVLIGADQVDFRKILLVYTAVGAGVTVLAMLAAKTGIIENLIYYQNRRNVRISFGSTYPTDFAAHWLYLIMAYAYLRGNRLRWAEYAVFAAAAVFLYVFCEARTNAGCIILFTAGCLAIRKMKKMSDRKQIAEGKGAIVRKTVEFMFSNAVIIFAVLMIVMVVFYQKDSQIMSRIDKVLFNTRVSQAKTGLDQYGICLIGQYIEMHGFGGKLYIPENYFFIDSSYIKILLCYGVIVFACVMLAYCLIGKNAGKRKDVFMMLIIGIVGIQCLYEHHMLEIAFNPFTLALFAEMGGEMRRGGCHGV